MFQMNKIETTYAMGKRYSLTSGPGVRKRKPQNRVSRQGVQSFRRRLADGSRNQDFLQPFRESGQLWFIASFLCMRSSLLPDYPIHIWWQRLWFALAVCYALITPTQVAFLYANIGLLWFTRMLDILGLILIYAGFHIAYFNHEGVLVSHPLCTAQHYFTTRFFFDFIACFPFDVFVNFWYLTDDATLHLSAFVRIIRLVLFYHIPVTFEHWERSLEKNTGLLQIFKLSIYTAFFLNTMTSALLLIACPPTDLFVFEASSTALQRIGSYECYKNSWLTSTSDIFERFRVADTSAYELYTICFYFACACSVNVGYDIHK